MEENDAGVVNNEQQKVVVNTTPLKELVKGNIKLKVMLTFAGVLLGVSVIEVLMYVLPPVFNFVVSIDLMPFKNIFRNVFFSMPGVIMTLIFLLFLGGSYLGTAAYYKEGKMTEQQLVHDLGIIIPWSVLALCVFAIQLWSLLQR